ncbi:MAG: M16 family metallopeptidase [Phycisphaerales bacterium]
MSGIHTHRLANGLTVALEPLPGMATASLCWLVPAGTAGDPDGAAGEGESTLLSELILRGAGPLESRAWSDALDAQGCERRTTANPFHVLMTATALGSRMPGAFELLADAIRRPRLDAEHVEPVRRLALQALEGLADEPQHQVMLMLAERFLPSPYNRSGYGHADGLRALTAETLRAAWRRRAVPHGSILALSGAVDPRTLLPLVERALGDWSGTCPEPALLRPALGGVHHHVQDSSQTHLALALPAPVDGSLDATALRLAAAVLGGESSSRLFTEVREKRGLCYSVGASLSLGRDRGMLQIYAGSTPQRAGQTLACIHEELDRFTGGIRSDEFERARTGLKARLVMQGESAAARASSVAGDLFRIGRARSLGQMAQDVDALSVDSVNAAIERHWNRSWLEGITQVSIGPAALQPGR